MERSCLRKIPYRFPLIHTQKHLSASDKGNVRGTLSLILWKRGVLGPIKGKRFLNLIPLHQFLLLRII